jgi:hypothetical protein
MPPTEQPFLRIRTSSTGHLSQEALDSKAHFIQPNRVPLLAECPESWVYYTLVFAFHRASETPHFIFFY